MRENILKIKEWWFGLNARDKKGVIIIGIAISLFLFYEMIWSPIFSSINLMRHKIVSEEKNLITLRSLDGSILQLEAENRKDMMTKTPASLLGLLQKKISEAKLDKSLTQLKQSGSDAIEMHFQNVEFDALMKLMTNIVKEEKVGIPHLTASAQSSAGMVDADIIIKII